MRGDIECSRERSAVVLGFLLCGPVHGQEVELEEILVTARKRTESVQDVPESITVFSAAEVEDAGITRMKDVADLTPNLVLRQS